VSKIITTIRLTIHILWSHLPSKDVKMEIYKTVLSTPLNGRGTRSLAQREEDRLRIFEIRVLREHLSLRNGQGQLQN
jgi:hypothetical protein